MAELTQAERDRLARWMGWELKPIVEGIKSDFDAWHDGTDYIMLPEHWNPDTDWNDTGMLLERLDELELEWCLETDQGCKRFLVWDENFVRWSTPAEMDLPAPLAICRAILAMLEASDEN